jgi:hypothetical protein
MSKEEILEKIKEEVIKMKPKSHFVFKAIIYVLGFIFIFLFVLFLASFIVFSLRIRGVWHFSDFGLRGVGMFFGSFPWLLLIFAIIFVVILEFFAKRFSLVYKKPLLYSMLGIVIIVFTLSCIIDHTSMHPQLFRSAREGRLPIMGPMYRGQFMESPHNVFIGRVLELNDNGFRLETRERENLEVIIPSEIKSLLKESIEKDDIIVVMGEREGSIIRAFGVHETPDDDDIYFPRREHMRSPMEMK